MALITSDSSYNDIISLENLLEAWEEFINGKKGRKDVQEFQRNLMSNIIALHLELKDKTYVHLPYEAFNISDPKPRNIHKASVRDRLLHHAIYRKLHSFFNRTFISDSYSCRFGKGTHKAVQQFRKYGYKASKNNRKTLWILKCDIRKFFASVDHEVLIDILDMYLKDKDVLWLLIQIIDSFQSIGEGKGLPLGNLTSQLLVNIYMNEFDQFVKHELKQKHYIRYADDFVIMHHDKDTLLKVLPKISQFLYENLKLSLHPDKIYLKTFSSGVDFLGWVHFPTHRVLRTTTKKRMFRNIHKDTKKEVIQSYLGLLSHGNTGKLQKKVANHQFKVS
ncbi:MAG: reverse transcriptase/maturase family protein [Candidatus Pacebacteria bacterium]|nr:reverse transcriptase/maturase family protein [Candidatus Paceibacterota bacterium]